MQAHAGRPPQHVTPLVEQRLQAEIQALAGEALPNVRFAFGDTLHPQSPDTANGEAGFVIAWKTSVTAGPANQNGHVPLDFSGTKIVLLTYHIKYTNQHANRKIRFSDGISTYLEPGPSSLTEHEQWHTSGVKRQAYERWARPSATRPDKKIIVGPDHKMMGFWFELGARRSRLQNGLRILRVTDVTEARQSFDRLMDTHLTSLGALAAVGRQGYWHSDVRNHQGQQVYDYNGPWMFVDVN